MNYQIFIDQNQILGGNVVTLAFIFLLIILLIIYLCMMIWIKLIAYETLKYEFITIIAHKFRTPLTKIKWIIEGILDIEKDSFKKENLINLSNSNQTLINLTGTLIELTDSADDALTSYKFEKVNICEFVKKITDALNTRFHEQNLFVGTNFSDPEIFVKIDRTRMEFVFQTIMENAINYSYTGKNVDIQVKKEGRKVAVSVIDQGIGIDPADSPRIFSKFFRAKNAKSMDTEGFGVGLYLANSIVKKHSGKLKISSPGVDKGTTVTILLKVVK